MATVPANTVDDMLSQWRPVLGADYDAYRNHVQRMLNFCFALHACSDEERQKLTIAACFHDLGIWSGGTFDYLPPSIAAASDYLENHGLETWVPEVSLIIDMHHKLRPFRRARSPLVEVFRRADLADLSMGVVRGGVPRQTVEATRRRYPNAGFHKRILMSDLSWAARHPWRPIPVARL